MQGVVAGMFPDNATAPMRVLVGSNGEGSAHTDYLHHHPDCCARFKKLLGRGIKGWSGTQMPLEAQALFARATAEGLETEEHFTKLYGILAWRDVLTCQLGSGLDLVPQVSDSLLADIDKLSAAQAVSWFSGGLDGVHRSETLRLAHGRTLGEILDRIDRAVKAPQREPRVVLYSAHDWTIQPILMMMLPASFGVPWPRFCADLKVELYRDSRGSSTRDSDYYVRVEYSPGTHGEGLPVGRPQAIRLAECGGAEYCELPRFMQAMRQWVPQDFDKECML